MRRKTKFIKGLGIGIVLIISISTVLTITNCSKKSDVKSSTSSSKLKSDSIHLLKSASISQLLEILGPGIINHMQITYDSTIKSINILSDSIWYSSDTCLIFKFIISCKGFTSKPVACKIVPYTSLVCQQETYTCIGGCSTACGMYYHWDTGVITCTCTGTGIGVCGLAPSSWFIDRCF
ncbi:MAG: hypothetical protein ABSD71_13030 [Bacteroidales bacterium]|jgi:hypothetical protein